jgi:hypothetical protein
MFSPQYFLHARPEIRSSKLNSRYLSGYPFAREANLPDLH